MKTQALSQDGILALDNLVERVYNDLSDQANIATFVASKTEQLDSVTGETVVIDAILDTIDHNRQIIDSIAGSSVVYAIWVTSLKTNESVIKYIGHVVDKGARTRLINHFVRKDPRTGAQLPNVRAALAVGEAVGVSFVKIEPAAVRLYVEEILIREYKPAWNIKSAQRDKKPIF